MPTLTCPGFSGVVIPREPLPPLPTWRPICYRKRIWPVFPVNPSAVRYILGCRTHQPWKPFKKEWNDFGLPFKHFLKHRLALTNKIFGVIELVIQFEGGYRCLFTSICAKHVTINLKCSKNSQTHLLTHAPNVAKVFANSFPHLALSLKERDGT